MTAATVPQRCIFHFARFLPFSRGAPHLRTLVIGPAPVSEGAHVLSHQCEFTPRTNNCNTVTDSRDRNAHIINDNNAAGARAAAAAAAAARLRQLFVRAHCNEPPKMSEPVLYLLSVATLSNVTTCPLRYRCERLPAV